MKKILSVALSTAMAFSMFASVAFGQAGLTDVNAQYNYLKDKGIFNGYPDGQAHLDRSMTRAEFAKVITKTLGLKEVTGVYSYNDKNYGANHWAAPYVEAVTAEGIMEGKNTTKKLFDLSGSVTVQEMATVLVRALDLEIPKETNNTASAWAKGYVQAAINAGLVEANANFQSNATRELLVGAAYAVDQKVAVSVKSYTVSEAGKVVEFTMNDGKTVKVTLDKALEANKETPVKFTYNGKEYTHNVTFVVEVAAVESVSAINGSQVQVTFSAPVAANDVDGKVSVEGVTLTSPVLSEDGKTLTLNAVMAGTNNPINVKNAAVVVNPIKTKADANVTTEKFVSLLTYKDTVAPTIKSVEAKTNGTVAKTAIVKMSEPIQTGALVKVNGAYASVSHSALSDTISLSGLNLETGKTHTVEVINAADAAGNKIVSQSATFTVAVDSVVPSATVTAGGSDKEILVAFDKSMNVDSVQDALTNGIVKSESLGAITSATKARVVPNTDDKQFIIDVTESSIFANKDSRTFSVVLPKDMEDKLGNKTAESIQKVTLTKDTVKPVATGYNVIKEADGKIKAIEVIFSEGLKASGSSDSIEAGQTLHQAASTIVNENGVAETTKFNNYVSKAVVKGDKKVVFEASTAEAITGKYAFSFNNELVKDLSEAGNKSAAFSYTIDFGQAKADTEFELTSAEVTNNVSVSGTVASSNIIKVVFGTAVKGGAVAGSATDVANYTLGGKPLPEGTTILLNGGQTEATITLPVGSIAQDDQAVVFTAANVKTTDGTKTLKSYTGTVKLADNVAPVLQSAKILDNKTIELTYSEAIQINEATTNTDLGESFVIKQGDAVLSLANNELTGTVASGFDEKLVLKIVKGSGGSATTLDLTKDITIETKAATTKKVVDKAVSKNEQQAAVKVKVVKP